MNAPLYIRVPFADGSLSNTRALLRDYAIKATLSLKFFYLTMEDAIFTFQESLRANNIQFKTGLELGDGPLTPKSTKTEVCSGVKTVRSCDIAGLACTYSERETLIQGYVHSKQSPCWYLVVLRCPPSSPIESAVYSCVCKAKDRKTRCSHACAIILASSLLFSYNPHQKKPKWMDMSRQYTKCALDSHLKHFPRAQFLGRSSYTTLLYSMLVSVNDDLVKKGMNKRHAFFFGTDKKEKTTSWALAISHYAEPVLEEGGGAEEGQQVDPSAADPQPMTDTIAREEENEHNSLAIQPLTTALLDPRSNDNDAPLEVRISPSTDVDASSKEEKNEEPGLPRRSLFRTFQDKEAILNLGKRQRKKRKIVDA